MDDSERVGDIITGTDRLWRAPRGKTSAIIPQGEFVVQRCGLGRDEHDPSKSSGGHCVFRRPWARGIREERGHEALADMYIYTTQTLGRDG